jgi:hypothetical protein
MLIPILTLAFFGLLFSYNLKLFFGYKTKVISEKVFTTEMIYLLGNTLALLIPILLCKYDLVKPYIISICAINSILVMVMASFIAIKLIENKRSNGF